MEDSPGKKNGCPVQYSFLENSLGREVWQATDHRFKRATQSLSNIHIHAHTHTHTRTMDLTASVIPFSFFNSGDDLPDRGCSINLSPSMRIT